MPKRELTDRELLELNRVSDGPNDLQQGGKPYHSPMPHKFPESIKVEELAPVQVVDVAKIAELLASDGGFVLRKKESVAIEEFQRNQAALLKDLEGWSHDAVRKRYNETFEPGRPSFPETLERARDARSQIKTRLRQANKAFAPIALAIFERARLCAQTCHDLALENEKSRCEWLGIPHTPSCVVLAARQGLIVLDRLVESARVAADPARVALFDSTGFRVLGITLDNLASVYVEED